jgi:hypothetical protein
MKETKRTLDHIELIQSDLAPMFEVKLLVVMEGYVSEDEGDLTAAGWLHNLLQMASDGQDISHGMIKVCGLNWVKVFLNLG